MRQLLIFILLLNFKSYSQEKFEIKVKDLNSSMKKNNTLLSKKRFSFIKKKINELSIEVFNILNDSLNNSNNIIIHVEFVQSYGYSIGDAKYTFYIYDVDTKRDWILKYNEDNPENFTFIKKTELSDDEKEYYGYIWSADVKELIKFSNSYKLRLPDPNYIQFEFAEFIYYLDFNKNQFNANNFMVHGPLSLESEF